MPPFAPGRSPQTTSPDALLSKACGQLADFVSVSTGLLLELGAGQKRQPG
jgi:hypothetical protein